MASDNHCCSFFNPLRIAFSIQKMALCKKVIDALGSPEVSQVMGQIGCVTPRPSESTLYGKKVPKYINNLDLIWAADNKARWNDTWKTKFREGKQ